MIFSTKNHALTHQNINQHQINSKPNINTNNNHKISPLEKFFTSFCQNILHIDYCTNQPTLHNYAVQSTSHYSYNIPTNVDSASQQNTNKNIETKNNSYQEINTSMNSQLISTSFHEIHNNLIVLNVRTQEEIVSNIVENQLLSEVDIISSTLEDPIIEEYHIEFLEMGQYS